MNYLFSMESNYQHLLIHQKNGYQIVELNRGKVNAINQSLSEELGKYFRAAEKDEAIKGVILTGRDNCFSAGFDLIDLMKQGLQTAGDFFTSFFDALQVMVNFSKPFITAATGYAPAAGSALVACGDYRIMAIGEKHKIGLHELPNSIVIPRLMTVLFQHWIGPSKAMEYILKGKLMNAEEAKQLGLINEALPVQDVLPAAEKLMKKLVSIHPPIYSKTKSFLKDELRAKMNIDLKTLEKEMLVDFTDMAYMEKIMNFVATLKRK